MLIGWSLLTLIVVLIVSFGIWGPGLWRWLGAEKLWQGLGVRLQSLIVGILFSALGVSLIRFNSRPIPLLAKNGQETLGGWIIRMRFFVSGLIGVTIGVIELARAFPAAK
jgi:hypothetical protein